MIAKLISAWNRLRYRWLLGRMDRNMRRFAEQVGKTLLPTITNYAVEMDKFNKQAAALGVDVDALKK